MRTKTTPDEFAFGDNTFDGCPCPMEAANKAGPNGEAMTVAEEYDKIVREILDDRVHEGTIPKSVAKRAWMEAVKITDQNAEAYKAKSGAADREHGKYLEACAQIGREIARTIF